MIPSRRIFVIGTLLPALPAGAQVVSPILSGFQRLTLPGNSDSYISTPFARPAAATALVQSVSGNVITVKGASPWQPGQFVNQGGPQDDSYYLLIVTGSAAGSFYGITASTANTLTVEP